MVWITVRISPGIHFVLVWYPICLLEVQPWSSLKVYQVYLNKYVLITGGLQPWKNIFFQLKFISSREYCSWLVWISGGITPESHFVRVWDIICLLVIQTWGFLKVHWMIIEIFCTRNRCIITLTKKYFKKTKFCQEHIFLGWSGYMEESPHGSNL